MNNEQLLSPSLSARQAESGVQVTVDDNQLRCGLCGLPAPRHISESFNGQRITFCCYGCRYIFEVVAPDLADGLPLAQAMGRAGLDLKSPCCRGILRGNPTEEADKLLARLMLNAFLAMMVMVLSLALYSDFFFADWGVPGQSTRTMLQAIAMLFATPAVLLLALPILEDAIFTYQTYHRLTTSALIAVGSLAAYGVSVYATFTGTGHTYFETAVMTLLLVTTGRWLDARTQVEGNKALDNLLARTPAQASLILANGQEQRTPVENIEPGNQIRVRPGENFAVDGLVLQGEGSVNQATITGEAALAYKGPGHTVFAGTTNIDGSFVVEATQVGDARVMGKLIRLLEEARLKRAPIEQLTDRAAAYFTPIVLFLAALTFVGWSWQVSPEKGLLSALAVLLIACPCALGVATPLAIWAALGRAAEQGVLIRSSHILEHLAHIRHMFFDKTGTLTTGQANLIAMVTDARLASLPGNRERLTAAPTQTDWLLQLAASLENGSEHPLARSVLSAAKTRQLDLLPLEKFGAIPGLGVSGLVAGRPAFVGSWRLVEQQGAAISPWLQQERSRLEQAGLTVVHVGQDNIVQGLLGFADTLRPSAQVALAEIGQQGLTVEVLTGDSVAAGQAIGSQLGIAVRSQLLPQDKVSMIEQAVARQPVAMVGDGLNDAPALARATVGIALGCGADVTREAADISLLGNDLGQVAWMLTLARRTYRAIGFNLIWAFAYNLGGVALAMAGLLHPVIAAAAMVLSSAMVVGNTLRILRF